MGSGRQGTPVASSDETTQASRRFSRSARIIVALDRAGDRRWFLAAVSAFPLADYVLPFLPNQTMLLALCVLRPARWALLAAVFVLAGGLGALVASWAVQTLGPVVVERLIGAPPAGSGISDLALMVQAHGLWALVVLAMLPWPPRSAVVVCAVAGLPPLGIGLAVLLGRIVPSAGYALLGAKASDLLRRFGSINRMLDEVMALREGRDRPEAVGEGCTTLRTRRAGTGRS